MSYLEEVAQARRLALLLALYFAAGYTSSLMLLRAHLEQVGYIASVDLMQTELAWLAEQGLVEALASGAHRLTARGEDVALGRSQTPGVRRPAPGEAI